MKNKRFDKAKNFSDSIKRLIKELNSFKVFIIISLVLASLGSVLTIIAPDKLSNLTDEISKGLVVDTKNIEVLTNHITTSLSNNIPNVIKININEDIVNKVYISNLSDEDKNIFKEFINNKDISKSYEYLNKMSEELLNIILIDNKYNNTYISISEQIDLLHGKYSDNLKDILFTEIKIDNTLISIDSQIDFINKMSSVDKSSTDQVYKTIDDLDSDIKSVISPKMDLDKIKNITLLLVSLYLISAIFTYTQSILMTDVSNKFARSLRNKISLKINKLPLKYFDNHSNGDILSRVTNDIDMVSQSMNHSLASLVSAITLFIGTIIMMFYTNWIMALTAILSSLFGFIFMSIVLSKSQKYFIKRQEGLGELNGHIEEIYSSLNIVKVYNGKNESDIKFDELNNNVYEANYKSQFLSGLMMPMMGFIGNFGYVMVCIVGALLVMNNHITFGVIVAFISYVRLFTSPLSQIAQGLTQLQSTAAASERVFEFLDEEEMKDESNIVTYLKRENVKGSIVFDDVEFTYDGNDKPTINRFNLFVEPGQKIAIVGPTGAGKTTLVNLLMRFYEISSGDIKIDGISINELSRKNIHDLFTMVLQDTWLFDGTIYENIVYNREDISMDKVKEVCKTVGVHHFIKTLPNGYNSHILDNDSISAGQRQLLTIARGMIEDSPFLILDEATSNVDTRTEEVVQEAMDKLTEGKTSFIIAHRLSTIKNADLILVMNEGNIIEQGNHEELIKKGGFYKNLYESQFKK